MNRLKDICFYLVIGFSIIGISEWLGSPFLPKYLKDNLITLLIALLAINTTTSSVIMTKLKEIVDTKGGDFSATIKELKNSIFEQIALIVIAILLLIMADSPSILQIREYVNFVLNSLLAAVFAASMHNLFDTAKSIFVILNHENK